MKKFFLRLLGAAVIAALVATVISAVVSVRENNRPVADTSVQAAPLTDVGGACKLWFSDLSNDGKHAYNLILSSIYSMPEEIEINRIDSETLDEVFYALMSDNPDLFFVGRKCTIRTSGSRMWFSIDYLCTKEEYFQMKSELDSVCRSVIGSLTDKSDRWLTELEIHDYIIDNCVYSEENTAIDSSAYGALVAGRAACEGYSKAAKLLLDAAGFESTVVTGIAEGEKGRNGPHMWNVVKLGEDWYHLDCTWDDPVEENGKQSKSRIYFNVDDALLLKTHKDLSKNFACDSMKENYFVKTGAYFDEYKRSDEKRIADIIIKETETGGETVCIRFADRSAFDSAFKELITNERIYSVLELAREGSEVAFMTNEVGYFTDEERLIFALEPKTQN